VWGRIVALPGGILTHRGRDSSRLFARRGTLNGRFADDCVLQLTTISRLAKDPSFLLADVPEVRASSARMLLNLGHQLELGATTGTTPLPASKIGSLVLHDQDTGSVTVLVPSRETPAGVCLCVCACVCSRGTNKRVVIFVASYDAWSYCALVAPCLCCADAESDAHSKVGTAPGGDADSLEILKMIEQRHRGRQAAQAATTGDSDPVHALAPINLQHVPLLGYLRATHVSPSPLHVS
jgi:hypothetical protein